MTSGILALTSTSTKRTYGFIDPSSGQYSDVATFTITSDSQGNQHQDLAVSPDFTKYAFAKNVNGQSSAGWIDTQGNYTSVTPTVTPGPFGGVAPVYDVVGFDGAGNFYYRSMAGGLHPNMYEVAAGSTSNAQEITTAAAQEGELNAYLNFDGTMQFGCNPVLSWLGPHATTFASSEDIVKHDGVTFDQRGCVTGGKEVQLLPATNKAGVSNAVGKSDGTAVAFKYDDRDLPGGNAADNNGASLYVVAADGSSQPTKVDTPGLTIKQLAFMTLLKWT